MALPALALSWVIAPIGSSRMIVVLRQSGFSSVRDTTYFAQVANGSCATSGSNASACPTYVRRPSSTASTCSSSGVKCRAMMSSCQYGSVQPPWRKPPSVSSFSPPGACITPSRLTNSETINLRIVVLLLLSRRTRARTIDTRSFRDRTVTAREERCRQVEHYASAVELFDVELKHVVHSFEHLLLNRQA